MKRFYRIWYTILPVIIGSAIGFSLSKQQKEIYKMYELPRLMPSQWVFATIWTILYFMLGYSLYRIWMAPRSNDSMLSAAVLIGQLAMNFIWSYVFFLYHQLLLAVLLHIAILLLGVWNYSILLRVDKKTAYLHIPYLIWLLFALYLSWSIYLLNL